MKQETKKWWFLASIVFLAFGLYLLGQAGVNAVDPDYNFAGDSGQLLTSRATSLVQFFFGLLAAIAGIFIFVVTLKTTPDED